MKRLEHEAKELLARFGVPVPAGRLARSAEEAREAARAMGEGAQGTRGWVVKAQILAGGRGKGGGILKASHAEEVHTHANALLGRALVTPQTGPQGQRVESVLVESSVEIAGEWYLSLLVDSQAGAVTVLASVDGGMDIEETAARSPERILRERCLPGIGLCPFQARRIAYALCAGVEHGPSLRELTRLLENLYRAFVQEDCSLLEVNPLAYTRTGALLALDAKIEHDSTARFRHANWPAETHADPLEARAEQAGINYIRLHGDIGCMVNGAGLAMATMDLIQAEGGAPANFLDVGGKVDQEGVEAALGIIHSDPRVRCVLVNIFGGIVRCDVVARGLVQAYRALGLTLPLVVRLEGAQSEAARVIVEQSGLGDRLRMRSDLREAALESTALAQAA